jgi:hypothetical protein
MVLYSPVQRDINKHQKTLKSLIISFKEIFNEFYDKQPKSLNYSYVLQKHGLKSMMNIKNLNILLLNLAKKSPVMVKLTIVVD